MEPLRSVAIILFLTSMSIQCDGQQVPTSICGRRIADYKPVITSSLPTSHWPWHAAIYHLDDSNVPGYKCGGTVITSNSILTAGHCVTSDNVLLDTARVSVALGKLNLAVDESTARPFAVAKIILHPDFTSIDLANDIAIVRISAEAIFDNYVQPICLWPANKLELSEVTGKVGTVVGWGKTETGEASNVLREALLPVVPSLICLATNRLFFRSFLSATTFCAGLRNGTGICDGDSGGSMTFEENGRYFIRGIVSLSAVKRNGNSEEADCDPSHYAIFTDVAQYLPWITEMTNESLKTIDDAQVIPLITKMTNDCVKEVQCEFNSRLYNDRNYLTCDVNLNIGVSEENCRIIFAPPANASVTWLNIAGGPDIFPDLSDAINKFENLKVVAYKNSKLKIIERSKLAEFGKIEILSLADNEISQLSANTFIDCKSLTQLELHNNKLREIHPDLLMELSSLKIIYFQDNQIEILPEELFRNNKELREIHIPNNQLKELHPDLLKNQRNLKQIYLYNNEIEILPEELFWNNIKLEDISIFKNKIKIIPPKLFKNLPNIERIFLGYNKIEILPQDLLRHNRKLKQFEIQHNQLKELHPDTFKDLVNLIWIVISDNQLEVLPEGLFRDNEQLVVIRLQNNKLKTIETDFQHLNILKEINLKGNVCMNEFCDVETYCGTNSLLAMQKKIRRKC